MQTKKAAVYQLLKRNIVSGEYKAGTILNEADLAQKLNVGKTPTREALILLAHDGLIAALPRVGYVVTTMTIQDLLEIFALRVLLEVEAISLACERITDSELSQLKANNQKEAALFKVLHAAAPGEHSFGDGGIHGDAALIEQGYQLNREFHRIVGVAAGNARLARLVESLIDDLERALAFDPYIADPSQHSQIIQHLEQRDKAAAQAAMRQHIEETLHRLTKRF